jgi:hypothetical protein
MEQIIVHPHKRYLSTESGKPFFWLGDTAWELFHRLNLDEITLYLDNRAKKNFNVIQAVLLAELDGLNIPNANGDTPLINNDPTKPNEAYFSFVDEVIQLANERNIYIGLLPTWGDKVTHLWGSGPMVFNPENARIYGRFLGERYRNTNNILFILGGDRPAYTDEHDYRLIWAEMAAGIDEGSGKKRFKTYHPSGGNSTSRWLQDEPWLDMHMLQSGHGGGHDVPVWEWISDDLKRLPFRPVLDAEPNYEDHPVNPWPTWDPALGYFSDYDVRKQIYRSVFAGGCGVTYGHHSIWQFITPAREPVTHPMINDWQIALDRPGAQQVGYLRELIESRPFFTRIPDQEILESNSEDPGNHIQATRDADGSFAMIYLPGRIPVTIRMDFITGETVRAWWFDPREGCSNMIGHFPALGTASFTPPIFGPDWVLVLDDASRDFPIPGECRLG